MVGRALNELSVQGSRLRSTTLELGHSSLSHLRDYPIGVRKIDRSFIDKFTTDTEFCAIVCSVIGLAKNLDMNVVAEGVETEDQMQRPDHARDFGCPSLPKSALPPPAREDIPPIAKPGIGDAQTSPDQTPSCCRS